MGVKLYQILNDGNLRLSISCDLLRLVDAKQLCADAFASLPAIGPVVDSNHNEVMFVNLAFKVINTESQAVRQAVGSFIVANAPTLPFVLEIVKTKPSYAYKLVRSVPLRVPASLLVALDGISVAWDAQA